MKMQRKLLIYPSIFTAKKITLTKEVLQIENTGITISENHITNLFDPFYSFEVFHHQCLFHINTVLIIRYVPSSII